MTEPTRQVGSRSRPFVSTESFNRVLYNNSRLLQGHYVSTYDQYCTRYTKEAVINLKKFPVTLMEIL